MNKISKLKIGDRARVIGFDKQGLGSYRRKLLAMGLTPGIEFELSNVAPLGDPVILSVRNYKLSLRKTEAEQLVLERI